MFNNEIKKTLTEFGLVILVTGLIILCLVVGVRILFPPFIIPTEPPETYTPAPATEEPTPITEEPTEAVADPPAPYESTGFENTANINQERLRVGQLEIEHPFVMTIGSSETVLLSVFVPLETASAGLADFERISIPANQTDDIDHLFNYSTFTVLYESMRAELRSAAFAIEPLQNNDPQLVDIDTPESRTTWAWIIKAPENAGEQVIVASIYLGASKQPSWTGSIKIEVVLPTNTPVPTFTNTPRPPTPTITPSPTNTPTSTPTSTVLEDVGREIRKNLNAWLFYVLGSLGTILAGLFGIIKTHLNRKDTILLKKKALNGAKGKEKKSLEDEIAHLESIKWWQFWR